MLDKLFDEKLQEKMSTFFLEVLCHKGTIKKYNKGEIIDPKNSDSVYIVVKGMVNHELISSEGKLLSLIILPKGTIFGEMDYFEGHRTCPVARVIEKDTEISIVSKEILNQELSSNPNLYNYLMHSVIRKYRILMLKLADNVFNDFRGKLASTLIRFAIMEHGTLINGSRITSIKSLTFFSQYLSCSRSNLSVTLSELKKEGLIETEKNEIIIKDKDKLAEYVNFVW